MPHAWSSRGCDLPPTTKIPQRNMMRYLSFFVSFRSAKDCKNTNVYMPTFEQTRKNTLYGYMGHTHTHTIAKHRQTLVKNEFCPCLRSNTCRKINMSFAAQKQSKPTGGGLSMKFCCRIWMHSSGGRLLHWKHAIFSAHIIVSVACVEHIIKTRASTRPCHPYTSFLYHNEA